MKDTNEYIPTQIEESAFAKEGKASLGEYLSDRYEVYQIKKGGMGVVYICYDYEGETPCALKTFQDRYLENQQMRERFIREAETWVALEKHQNIVRADRVENIQDKPYIVLEYISNPEMNGADLGRWIKRGMKIPQVLNFAVQFCDGMDYVYKKAGVVHRDIKPGNILVTQNQVVKITDFGLVKRVLAEASGGDFLETAREEVVSEGISFPHTGEVMGTPPYMSPEQCRNAEEIDIRSDIYAFGTVLYEMLTGRWVFEATTTKAFVRCHLYEPPPSPTSLVLGLPRDLEAVLLRCLAKKAGQRYSDFAELREELAGIYEALTGEEVTPPVRGEALEYWEWYNKGASLAELGQHEEALACYDRALDIDPELTPVWVNKAAALNVLGRLEEALTCYDHIIPNLEENYSPFFEENLLTLAAFWVNKGAILATLARCEEALACFDRALDIDPINTKAWYNKAIALNVLERPEEALACYDRIILDINPRDASAWYNKGTIFTNLGRIQEALICFTKVLEIDPHNAMAKRNIAICQQNLKPIDLKDAGARVAKGPSLDALEYYKEELACYGRGDPDLDPGLAQAWYKKGSSLKAMRHHEEALIYFDRALDIDPNNDSVWFKKGLSLETLRRYEEALACFDHALDINPGYGNTWHNKGVVLAFLGCLEEALICFDRALDIDPNNDSTWFDKGSSLQALGRPKEALACYDCALEINPRDAQSWYKKGVILAENLRRYEEALACFDRALDIDISLRSCVHTKYSMLDPRRRVKHLHIDVWYNKGTIFIKSGKFREALDCYTKALEINPFDADAKQFIAVCQQNLKQEESSKGASLAVLGRYEEALTCYNRILEIDPRDAQAWFNKGVSLAALGRHEEALICYDHALEIDPRDTQAWCNKGFILEALGDPKEALACFDRVLDIDPRDASAWYNRGTVFIKSGKFREALDCYAKALEINPFDADAKRFTALCQQNLKQEEFNKGASLAALGRNEEALTCYDRVLEIDPRDAQVWSNKGVSLAALGRNEEALICYDHALKIDPKDAQVWSNKGASLAALGRNEEALTCYDRALEIEPRCTSAWVNKGVIHAMSGRFQEALGCFTKVLEIDPYAEDAKRGIAICQQKLEHLDPEEVLAYFERILELNPRDTKAWDNKGLSLYKLGCWDEALACCDQILALNPIDGKTWFNKGNIFVKLRKFQEALRCFTKVLDIDPSDEDAKQRIAFCQRHLKI